MNGVQVEYLVGLYFIGVGFDRTPNWFKVGFGGALVLLAVLKVSLV
jgi:hypothetical protein